MLNGGWCAVTPKALRAGSVVRVGPLPFQAMARQTHSSSRTVWAKLILKVEVCLERRSVWKELLRIAPV